MSLAKVSAYSTPDAVLEQKTSKVEKDGNDSFNNFIGQAVGKEPLLSFSRAGESPIQWIQLLHALDQQGGGKVSRGPRIENIVEGKERPLDYCNGVSSSTSEINGVKEYGHSMKVSGVPAKVTKSPSEQMQTLKIPEAVVAFAQAAAKANGEPEKYLSGWPLLSPPKVQLQKCDKCSREFCSPVNYRRHIRVHRRSFNVDKVSPKNRELLGVFWDKLSLEEAKELASFKTVTLEEVLGSSIIWSLSSLVRKPGFSTLPQVYVKAGATLLDVVQAKPSRFPISSQELFSILDDASEKTFLCAGTAISLQKFVFDGEVGKIALETKNLVACTSFLLEQKLVKAWLADKDAEALRCQKLLFEEEEAAQKRQAELLEKRRMKKLRQREQKTKEQMDVNKDEGNEDLPDGMEETSCSAGTLNPEAPPETDLNMTEVSPDSNQPVLEHTQSLDNFVESDMGCYLGTGIADQNVDPQAQQGTGRRQPILPRRPISKPTRNVPNGFHSQVVAAKPMVAHKLNSYKDPKSTSLANGQKVWTRKNKSESEEADSSGRDTVENEIRNRSDGNCEVLIGSISVTLGDSSGHHQDLVSVRRNNIQDSLIKVDSSLNNGNRATVKLWRPVGRQEVGSSETVQSNGTEAEMDGFPNNPPSQILPEQSCVSYGRMADDGSQRSKDSLTVLENGDLSVSRFSSKVAEAFLAQRWKEAIASDHVELILSPETEAEAMELADDCEDSWPEAPLQPIDSSGRSILGSAENWLAGVGTVEMTASGGIFNKPKFRAKPEKTYRLKYIPKQKK